MPLPSLRRKSRPENIARSEATANASFPAGEVSPVQIDGPEPVLKPHMQPRPRSSWYSQGSVSGAAPLGYTNPHAPPPAPARFSTAATMPLTPTALLSLDEAARRTPSEGWEDDELPESPCGTRQSTPSSYISRNKHTAMSEYLRERAWVLITPTTSYAPSIPASAPPPVPSLGTLAFPRFSFTSDRNRPLSRRGSRRESVKSKRSSITTLPCPVWTNEHGQLPLPQHPLSDTPNHSTSTAQTPSSNFSSPFPFSISRSRTKTDTSVTSTAPQTPAADPFISTPYEEIRRGRSPIPVTTLHAFDHQVPSQGATNAALIKGLSPKYGHRPQQTPTHAQTQIQPQPVRYSPTSYCSANIPKRFDSVMSQTRATVPQPPPSSYSCSYSHSQPRTQAHAILHANPTAPRILNTRTRNPTESSDEGSWLYIGTLRGPTPAGVRMMDEIIARSLEKKGTAEKGVKEIRKLLRHESRTTIEWTERYLKGRWGVGVVE